MDEKLLNKKNFILMLIYLLSAFFMVISIFIRMPQALYPLGITLAAIIIIQILHYVETIINWSKLRGVSGLILTLIETVLLIICLSGSFPIYSDDYEFSSFFYILAVTAAFSVLFTSVSLTRNIFYKEI